MRLDEINYLKQTIDQKFGNNNGNLDTYNEITIFNEQLIYHAKGDIDSINKYLIGSEPNTSINEHLERKLKKGLYEPNSLAVQGAPTAAALGAVGVSFLSTLLADYSKLPKFAKIGIPIITCAAGIAGTILTALYSKKAETKYEKKRIMEIADEINLNKYNKTRNKELEIISSMDILDKEKRKNAIEILYNKGFKKLDYAKVNDDMYEFFMKKGDTDFEFKFTKTSETSFSGIMSKINANGESELYLTQVEYIDARISPKMKVSTVRIVQEGVTDDSPYHIKEEKPRQISITNENATSHTKSKSSLGSAIVYSKLNKEITREDSKNIEQIIKEVRPEYKKVTILSK